MQTSRGKIICKFLTVYFTLRYPFDGLFQGLILHGHDFIETGEVHYDHWEIECKRCGFKAGSEVKLR